MDTRTALEERIAHLMRQIDELSDVVADQAQRLDQAERRIAMLMQRAAQSELDADSGHIPLADQRPPHW